MHDFTFCAPTRIVFGRDTERQVGALIAEYGYSRVLLHYGGGSIRRTGLYDTVTASLQTAGISYCELGGVQPNPTLSLVKEGVRLARSFDAQLILAVGGGSAIDSAKAIAVGAKNEGDPWRFFMKEAVPTAALPVATVLTLAATGSEMSSSAVITNEALGLKRGYNTQFHRPLFSILDPALTFTLPPYQTACGIVDIMMHTLERYLTLPGEAALTDRLAEGLLKAVIESGSIAMREPENYEARANLMWAGALSHNDLTGCGRPFFMDSHQLEHEVSGMFPSVAHGAGLAVIFPKWARFVLPHHTERLAQYAVRVWDCEPAADDPAKTALAGIERTEAFFRSLGMPDRLAAFGVTESDIPLLSRKCTNFGKRILPGVVPLGEEEIAAIFRMCL